MPMYNIANTIKLVFNFHYGYGWISRYPVAWTYHRQARSSLYANTQLRAHRRAEEKKIKSKTNKINKE
jgi:hypothetical protein